VKDLLKNVDILLYASGSEDILQWVPNNVEVIEYLHAPVPESLNRLRPLLA